MAKQTDNSIIISAPRQGVAQSPHVGFGSIVNVDIDSVPGIAQLNRIMTKTSGSIVTGLPQWIVRNPLVSGHYYALDSNGVVYKNPNTTWAVLAGNVTTSAAGNGLLIWKDFLFVARNATLDTYGPLSGESVTVVAATNVFTSSIPHGLQVDDRVVFPTTFGVTPPAPLVAETAYWVNVTAAPDTFELSLTQGGATINITDTGTGSVIYSAWKSVNSFKTIDSDIAWHPMLMSKNDNKLYGGAGRYVFSLDEATAPFRPGIVASFSWTQQALDLPPNYKIKCLEELGGYLMSGTWQGTTSADLAIADIFPWDRSSLSFGQPISLKEFGVHAMLNTGSELIVLAGVTGKIYGCNGASAYLIGQIPDVQLSDGRYLSYYPGSISSLAGKVFFGVGSGGTGVTTTKLGVYSLRQTGQGNILNLEYLNSQLTDGSTVDVDIGAIVAIGRRQISIGWRSDTSYGIDVVDPTSYLYTTNYSSYFESPLYIVGDNEELRQFTKIKILFAKTLATGEGIRVKYRTNLTDSFAVLTDSLQGVYGFATLGAVSSYVTSPGIPLCEMIQIRVEFLGSATTTPQFKQIKLC